jgi:hypothetical protein
VPGRDGTCAGAPHRHSWRALETARFHRARASANTYHVQMAKFIRPAVIVAACLVSGLATAACSKPPDQTVSYQDGYDYAGVAGIQSGGAAKADPGSSCASFSLSHMLAGDNLQEWEDGCIAYFQGAPPPHVNVPMPPGGPQ